MARLQRRLLFVVVQVIAAAVSFVAADRTITVDGADLSIHYTTVPDLGGYNNQTWVPVARSDASCDTPQMLTSRLGDYMTFTFTGTGLEVVGTIGKKRGLIQFTFDGQNTTFDRSSQTLVCDSVLFRKSGLPYEQHTVSAMLIGEAPDYSSGVFDAVLSVQRIRYFVPGGGSKSNVGAIAGGVAGGVIVAIIAAVCIFICLRRKKQKRQQLRRGSRASFDGEDVPPHMQVGGKPVSTTTTPGIVATPFEWNGPNGQYALERPQSHQQQQQQNAVQQGPSYSPTAPSFAPSTTTSPYTSGVPAAYTNRPSSQGWGPTLSATSSDVKRDSALSGSTSAAAHHALGLANPEEGSRRESSPPHDALVDRIANRLADIMHTRAGGAGVLDQIAPPPQYVPQYVSPNQAISNMREQASMERARSGTPTTMLPYAEQGASGAGSPPPPDPRTSYTKY